MSHLNAEKTKEQSLSNMKRVTFNIPESLFKQLKWLSIREEKTMLEIGAEMAKEYIESRK